MYPPARSIHGFFSAFNGPGFFSALRPSTPIPRDAALEGLGRHQVIQIYRDQEAGFHDAVYLLLPRPAEGKATDYAFRAGPAFVGLEGVKARLAWYKVQIAPDPDSPLQGSILGNGLTEPVSIAIRRGFFYFTRTNVTSPPLVPRLLRGGAALRMVAETVPFFEAADEPLQVTTYLVYSMEGVVLDTLLVEKLNDGSYRFHLQNSGVSKVARPPAEGHPIMSFETPDFVFTFKVSGVFFSTRVKSDGPGVVVTKQKPGLPF